MLAILGREIHRDVTLFDFGMEKNDALIDHLQSIDFFRHFKQFFFKEKDQTITYFLDHTEHHTHNGETSN